MNLTLSDYEFELSSLKSIKEQLIISEKLVNQIYNQIQRTEKKIRDLNLGVIFKENLELLNKKISENFVPLIDFADGLSEDPNEIISKEIQLFYTDLKQTFTKFQNILNKIITKTPEEIGPLDIFNDIDKNYIPYIYNSIDKLMKIIENDVPPEIEEKTTKIYNAQYQPLNEINSNRRPNKTEFKTIKEEIEVFFTKIKSAEDQIIVNQKQLGDLDKRIGEKISVNSETINKMNEIINKNRKKKLKIEFKSTKAFQNILEKLKDLIDQTHNASKKINEFFKELNFGVIFQQDLEILNDIIYDHFDPLLKSCKSILNRPEASSFEKLQEFYKKFQQKIIEAQEKLNEIVENSLQPLKQMEIGNEINLPHFIELKTSLKKITKKSVDIYTEIKNIIKFIEDIGISVSDVYLKELNSMNEELKTFKKDLSGRTTSLEKPKEAKLETKVEERTEPAAIKIALLGLGAAGKTSFLEVIHKNFGKLQKLKPTVGVSKKILNLFGSEVTFWDYGGQEIYRREYITKSHKFLTGIDLILYFIDVQDETIDESIEYFQKLVNLPEIELLIPIKILGLIHKMDPDLNNLEIQSKVNIIKERFNSIIKGVSFFETSIFDYWSILSCFSEGLKRIVRKEDLFKNLLKEFAKNTLLSAVILLEENFFILEQYGNNEENLSFANEMLHKFINSWARKAAETIPEKTKMDLDMEKKIGRAKIFFQKFTVKDKIYYLLCYSKRPQTEKLITEKLPQFASEVYNISNIFFSN